MPQLLEQCRQVAPSVNLRLIGSNKDNVGEMLEQGELDVAIGVFQHPPRQTLHLPLFKEKFVGMIRKNHPSLTQRAMTLETFASLPHALSTIRQDTTGEIDKVLADRHLQRRVALTTSHPLILPAIISTSDLVASVPFRIANRSRSAQPLATPNDSDCM